MSIGRNTPCPCGSGKKFKKCCLNKKVAPRMPWHEVSEDYAIGQLLRDSVAFERFLEAERHRIRVPIRWAHDKSLPQGIDFRLTRLESGESIIRLRRVPAERQDALKIAHELTHIIQDGDGFPVVGGAGKLADLASALSSMLHDPLLHEILSKYDFDLKADAKLEFQEAVRRLSGFEAAPQNRLGRAHWTLNYVGNLLEWDSAGCKEEVEAFRQLFHDRFPEIAKEGESLLELVKCTEFDSPEKMLRTLRMIIDRYKLAEHLVVLEQAPSIGRIASTDSKKTDGRGAESMS